MKAKQYRYFPALIFIINLIIYSLFNYGGIRSPDSEIVFRTTESLVLRNEFAVPEPIDWTYFGLASGIDQKHYSIFGPAESILAIPFLNTAYFLERHNLVIDSNYIPISFNLLSANKITGVYFIEGERPPDMNGQYRRFIVSFINPIIGALSGVFLYFVLVGIARSKLVGIFITYVYSFGSLIFPYTGTFFSEPLCTMFIILSFLFVVKNEISNKLIQYINWNYFFSGLFLGLAITTHISAVLSVPFYYMFIIGQISKEKLNLRRIGISSLCFSTGLIIFCSLLLYYNYARFGNIFETGRTASLYNYGIFSNPLLGLYGLLVSPGKGLLVFAPIIFLGIIFWRSFHRSYPHLSIIIIGMIATRLFFIASRSDWHGGFCLGPRYLVIILPFLFLPIAIGLKDILLDKKLKYFVPFSIFSFICILQQLFFSTGEIFSYLHILFRRQEQRGIDTLVHNSLYLDWQYSPALYLLNFKVGPFFLRILSTNTYGLWFWTIVVFLVAFIILCCLTYKSSKQNSFSDSLSFR